MSRHPRVVIIPGNGCSPVKSCNFYLNLQTELLKSYSDVILEEMPDPFDAKEGSGPAIF